MTKENYDVVIIGAGIAAFTAAVYSVRYGLKTLVLGKQDGGKLMLISELENWPGEKKITGVELFMKLKEQIENLGVDIEMEEVFEINKIKSNLFKIKTVEKEYFSRAVILAYGSERRKLGVPRESDFFGKGIFYCATCDAPLVKGKDVVVAGGGNGAFMTAEILEHYANKVTLFANHIGADKVHVDRMNKSKKISFIKGHIKDIKGNNQIEKVILDTNEEIKCQAIFVEIGNVSDDKFAKQLSLKTEKGYILVDTDMKTSVPGIFAAGDCIKQPLYQLVTAAGGAATAAFSAFQFLKD